MTDRSRWDGEEYDRVFENGQFFERRRIVAHLTQIANEREGFAHAQSDVETKVQQLRTANVYRRAIEEIEGMS